MRAAWILLISLALVFAGCGGGGGDESGAGSTASGGEAGGEGDLTRNWGPEEMPDPDAEPEQFLYWRVDQLFEDKDMDADGRLSTDEYSGESFNFERIDADADGFITKKEIIDDMIPVLREEGRIPLTCRRGSRADSTG